MQRPDASQSNPVRVGDSNGQAGGSASLVQVAIESIPDAEDKYITDCRNMADLIDKRRTLEQEILNLVRAHKPAIDVVIGVKRVLITKEKAFGESIKERGRAERALAQARKACNDAEAERDQAVQDLKNLDPEYVRREKEWHQKYSDLEIVNSEYKAGLKAQYMSCQQLAHANSFTENKRHKA